MHYIVLTNFAAALDQDLFRHERDVVLRLIHRYDEQAILVVDRALEHTKTTNSKLKHILEAREVVFLPF